MSLLSGSTLLRLVVGQTWQNFIGLSYEETRTAIQSVADDRDWKHIVTEEASSLGERIMLGDDETTTIEFKDHGFTIECISASYDPFQRAILGLAVREETKSKYEDAATVLRISPINSQTEPDIATFVAELMEFIEKDPWEIIHPRFNLSPVLKYKTRLFWEYWQLNAREVS